MCHGFFKLLISTLHNDTAGKFLYIWKFYIFLSCPPIAQHPSCKYLHETIKLNAVMIRRKGKNVQSTLQIFFHLTLHGQRSSGDYKTICTPTDQHY